MKLDYQSAENHVTRRDGLPAAIRPTLLESVREEWSQHPRFRGKANFFMNIHRNLLDGAEQLSKGFEQLMDVPEGDLKQSIATSGIVSFGNQLINFAHGHHEIEDHGYFPQFIKLYPQLEQAMGLLDADHRILETALNDTHATLGEVSRGNISRDQVAKLYRGGRALDKILNRHIWDEEEIIVPILLKHG